MCVCEQYVYVRVRLCASMCSSPTSCSFACKVARRGSKSALVGFRHAESLRRPGTNFRYRREPPSNFRVCPLFGTPPSIGAPGELEKPPKSFSYDKKRCRKGRGADGAGRSALRSRARGPGQCCDAGPTLSASILPAPPHALALSVLVCRSRSRLRETDALLRRMRSAH